MKYKLITNNCKQIMNKNLTYVMFVHNPNHKPTGCNTSQYRNYYSKIRCTHTYCN